MAQTETDLQHDDIARRAHDISLRGDGGSDLENWLQAESELTTERENGASTTKTAKAATTTAPRARKPRAKAAEKA